MMLRATVGLALALGLAILASACEVSPTTGVDKGTDTLANSVTWKDGKPAIQINCGQPGGCSSRALAMCKGKYAVLDQKNMPTEGRYEETRGAATVVVRCG